MRLIEREGEEGEEREDMQSGRSKALSVGSDRERIVHAGIFKEETIVADYCNQIGTLRTTVHALLRHVRPSDLDSSAYSFADLQLLVIPAPSLQLHFFVVIQTGFPLAKAFSCLADLCFRFKERYGERVRSYVPMELCFDFEPLLRDSLVYFNELEASSLLLTEEVTSYMVGLEMPDLNSQLSTLGKLPLRYYESLFSAKKESLYDDTSRFMTEDIKHSCMRRHQFAIVLVIALAFLLFALYLIIVAPSAGTWPL